MKIPHQITVRTVRYPYYEDTRTHNNHLIHFDHMLVQGLLCYTGDTTDADAALRMMWGSPAGNTSSATVQADLMMKLVARIRDFLTEFLSKYLSVKPIWQQISSFKSPALQNSCQSSSRKCEKLGGINTKSSRSTIVF